MRRIAIVLVLGLVVGVWPAASGVARGATANRGERTLGSTASAAASAPVCIPPPPRLVAWWPGDGDTVDVVGGHDGTLQNGAGFAPGLVGQALSLDGLDDFVQVADSPSWNFGTSAFSLDLWANFSQVNPRAALLAHDEGSGPANKWIFWFDSEGERAFGPALRFHINSPSLEGVDAVVAPFQPVPETWYHLALTRSGSTYTLYIDGTQVASETDANAVPDAVAPLTIGQAEGTFNFSGLIDEVEVFNRALSPSEVASIFNASSAGKCKHPSQSLVAMTG